MVKGAKYVRKNMYRIDNKHKHIIHRMKRSGSFIVPKNVLSHVHRHHHHHHTLLIAPIQHIIPTVIPFHYFQFIYSIIFLVSMLLFDLLTRSVCALLIGPTTRWRNEERINSLNCFQFQRSNEKDMSFVLEPVIICWSNIPKTITVYMWHLLTQTIHSVESIWNVTRSGNRLPS